MRREVRGFPAAIPYIPLTVMAPLDLVLTIVFGLLSLLGLTASGLCFRTAMRVATQRDSDLRMFLWAAAAMVGLIVAGVSCAYILLPIMLHY